MYSHYFPFRTMTIHTFICYIYMHMSVHPFKYFCIRDSLLRASKINTLFRFLIVKSYPRRTFSLSKTTSLNFSLVYLSCYDITIIFHLVPYFSLYSITLFIPLKSVSCYIISIIVMISISLLFLCTYLDRLCFPLLFKTLLIFQFSIWTCKPVYLLVIVPRF